MEKAWPRFLAEPGPGAIAHALIIEAYAIVVGELREGHETLYEAHERALRYAALRHSAEEIRAAIDACATAPENQSVRLPYLVMSWPPPQKIAGARPLRPAA